MAIALCVLAGPLRAAEVATSAAKPTPAAPAATRVADVVTQITASEDLQRRALAQLKQATRWRELNQRSAALQADFEKLAPSATTSAAAKAELVDLLELARELQAMRERASGTVDDISAIARELAREEDRLEAEVEQWHKRLTLAEERHVPAQIIEAARSIETALRGTGAQVREGRDDALLALDRAVRLHGRIDGALATVVEATGSARADLVRRGESPLWQLAGAPSQFAMVAAESRAAYASLRGYLVRDGAGLAALLVCVLLPTYWLFRSSTAGAPGAQRAFGRPAAASLLIALGSVWLWAPTPPLYFYPAILTVGVIPAAMVAERAVAAPIPLTIYGIALSAVLLALRDLLEASSFATRGLLLLQAASIGIPLAADLHRGRLHRALPRFPPRMLRGVALLAVIVATLMVLGAIFGFVGPARSLRTGMGSLLGFGLVLGATAVALYGAVLALVDTPVGRSFRFTRNAKPKFLRAVRFVLALSVVASVALATLGLLGVLPAVASAFEASMRATMVVGTVKISAKEAWTALAVILTTLLVNAVIGFILTYEILPRLRLREGAGFAIATLTRWAIVVVGVVLTLSALGIEMAQITLLAGALGVGIGFGLQNIVNNFVSGLILIVERPMYVGDLIEVGPLQGEIRRIAIRSSTVRTAQGAEVIVPNSNLVSKEVVNWTRSNRERRYDIDVAVAYGSDPEQVIRSLEEAAKEVPDIIATPAPRAMFVGFGDSSLDFRLLAWVQSIDVGIQAQNALRAAILRKLDAAGIAIP